MLATGLVVLAAASNVGAPASSGVAVSVEDVFGLSYQRFGDAGGDRLVHLGAFPMLTGVRVGVHHVGESGLVLGGLLGAATGSVQWPDNDDARTTFVSLAPRAGYAFGREGALGGWVRGGPTVRVVSTDKSKTWIDLSVEAHLIWTFAPGVALLVGPSLEVGLAKPQKRHSSVGLLTGFRVLL